MVKQPIFIWSDESYKWSLTITYLNSLKFSQITIEDPNKKKKIDYILAFFTLGLDAPTSVTYIRVILQISYVSLLYPQKIRWLLKLQVDQNLIVINHKPNSDFKIHLIFGGT
jgi:hypothetical protein